MPYLPPEIQNLIICMSYKLLYEDVLNEFKTHINEFDFIFPFKRMLVYDVITLIYVDEREEDLQEVIFDEDLELYYI